MRYLLALAPLCCCAVHAESLQPSAAVTILLSGTTPRTEVSAALKKAVESAFAESRLNLSWLDRGNLPPTGVSGELLIIRLKGSCGPDESLAVDPLHREEGPVTLGLTHTADGKVLPIADVLCDPIRNLLARDLAAEPAADRADLFGRALGRVAAHEIHHILLHTAAHSRTGLNRATQSAADLLSDEASLQTVEDPRPGGPNAR